MSINQLIAHRFEIQDLLGRGGMGEVFRALDVQTGQTVAVKALNPEIIANAPDLLKRFVREGEALRLLNHPNIVHMIAMVEEQERHFLVMEFVEGGSLRDLLNTRGCLPASEVVKIALEVADALTRAHHLGVIHRDLKPANVLLAKDGTPRLADFGLAHVESDQHLTQSGMMIGTVDYLSPELCQGEPPNDLSDIWAFGVMLFEMLSGKLPFEGKSLTAKITAILNQPLPDLIRLAPDTPDVLVDLICRMLEKDSRQRIPSIRLVAAELEGILKGRKPTSPGVAAPLLSSFEAASIGGRPVFVGREQELKQLDKSLGKTLAGHGQVAFIIGDPGQGKTALLQEFGQRAQKTYTGLVVASGNCNAYTGIGDPYLPFREVMGMLTGDVETLREAGVIGQTQATRLWNTFPYVIQYLIESGHNLVDIFVPGADLLQRAGSIPFWIEREKWLPQLEQLVASKASQNIDPSIQQAALFEQFTRLARALAQHAPLILLLDDLQWADSGSINLLFHLGKRLEGSRVMVVGAYRPTEVALGRSGERHPLEPVINEFKRQFGEIQVDLSQSEGWEFVNSFLDTEPNRLDESFRQEFFRISGGHPLTTIELLRDMQERGGLVKDADGYWITSPALNWETLPVRVEATIAERMERLNKQELAILRVAGVQGETFSAEVVSRVVSIAVPEVVSCLSSVLDREHRLVSAQGIQRRDDRHLSVYRFRHILFQRYLYNSLDSVERTHLHRAVGSALQEIYGEQAGELAVQLAHHFKEAGTTEKAADYLSKAGDRAFELLAHQEAIENYQQAMTAYEYAFGDRWDPAHRATLEYKTGESFFRRGEFEQALECFRRALHYLGFQLPMSRWEIRLAILSELTQRIGHLLFPSLFLKRSPGPVAPAMEIEARVYIDIILIDAFSRPERYFLIAFRLLNRSEQCGFSYGTTLGAVAVGTSFDFLGLLGLAGRYHRRALKVAEQLQHPVALGYAKGNMCYHGFCVGELVEGLELAKQAINPHREIGELRHMAQPIWMAAYNYVHRGDLGNALPYGQDLVRLGQDAADPEAWCWGELVQGYALRRMGRLEAAITHLKRAIELSQTIPDYLTRVPAGAELGLCYLRQGQWQAALTELETSWQLSIEHSMMEPYGVVTVLCGLAEAFLYAAEQSEASEKLVWLDKSKEACRAALKKAKVFRVRLPKAMRLQGRYEWLRGNPTASRKWWRRSLAMAEIIGLRYDMGVIHREIGHGLGDRDHLKHAESIFAEIGAEWDLKCTQEELEKL